VTKKDGSVRVCVDYRKVNEITAIPAVPIPRVKELLQKLGCQKLYHSFDLANGYHNVVLEKSAQEKTAIILPDDLGLPARQFEFLRLPFGLAAAPGMFQRIVDRLMMPSVDGDPNADLGPTTSSYLDDCCIAGDSFDIMLQRLVAFFNRIRAPGLLLKAKKCELFQPSVIDLGHKVCAEGIKVEDNKIEKVRHWPLPINVKELRTWLG